MLFGLAACGFAHAASAPSSATPNAALPPAVSPQPQGCDIKALNDQIKADDAQLTLVKGQRSSYASALAADQAKLAALTGTDDAAEKQKANLRLKIAVENTAIAVLDKKISDLTAVIDRAKANIAICERGSSRNLQLQREQRPGGKP